MSKNGLGQVVDELMPERYGPHDVAELWRLLTQGGDCLTLEGLTEILKDVTFRRRLHFQQQVTKHLARSTSEPGI